MDIVGLVANVVTITVAAVDLCTNLYNRVDELMEKSGSVPEVFATMHASIPLLLEDLERFRTQLNEHSDDRRIAAAEPLIGRFLKLLKDLSEKLEIFIVSDEDSPIDKLQKAWKSIHFEDDAERIWRQICECRNSLQFDRLLAWTTPQERPEWVPPLLDIPQGRQVEFVGRRQILSKIAERLSDQSNGFVPPTVVLRGMGGQGKTQLALKFCVENRDRGRLNGKKSKEYRAIFWIDASSEATARRSFLRLYGLPAVKGNTSLTDEDAQVRHIIQTIQGWAFPWLMVFDNYDTPSAFTSIRDYIPVGHNGAVLITSRHENSTQVGKVLDIPPLSREEGVELFLQQIRETDEAQSSDVFKVAEDIVVKLGCHALAIHQAGCFIKQNGVPLPEFLKVYNEKRAEVLTMPAWAYASNVFTTFQLAFDTLPYDATRRDSIERFLEISSYLAINRIPDTLFIASMTDDISALDLFRNPDRTWNQAAFQSLIRKLREFGFVLAGTPAARTFVIHPLVADWLKARGGVDGEASRKLQLKDGMLAARIVKNSLEAAVQDCPHRYFNLPLDIRHEILPHVMTCEEIVRRSSNRDNVLQVHGICETFAEFLDSCGMYGPAQALQEAAIEALQKESNPGNETLTTSICLLAKIYENGGMSSRAEGLLRARLNGLQRALDVGDLGSLAVAESLTQSLWYQRKFTEGEELGEKVLAIRQTFRPFEKRELLRCRATLAWTWQNNNKISKAAVEQDRILSERRALFGPTDLDTLASYNAQGCIYLAQGRLQEAEAALQKAAEGRKSQLGEFHPSTLNALTNLSMVIASRKRWTEAVSLGKWILDAREKQLGQNHIATLVSVANLLEILKYAPAGLLPSSEHTRLQSRIVQATAQGLWEWTTPGGGEPVSRSGKGVLNGERRFARQKFMRHLGAVFQQSPMAVAMEKERMVVFQSQQQQHQ